MPLTVTHHYSYQLGPVEAVKLEVLNNRYGRIHARRWHTSQSYALELATLNPQPNRLTRIAYPWLAAAIGSLLGTLAFLLYLLFGPHRVELTTAASGLAILIALTLLFTTLFFIHSSRRLIFTTRFSQLPLLSVPLPWRRQQSAADFAAKIGLLASENRQRLDYTDEEMRAGEMRMLRRLAEEGAIEAVLYTEAKKVLLRTAY